MYVGKRVFAEPSSKDELSIRWSDTTEDTLVLPKDEGSEKIEAKLSLEYSTKEKAQIGDIVLLLPSSLFIDVENDINVSLLDKKDDASGFTYEVDGDFIRITNYKELAEGSTLSTNISYSSSEVKEGSYTVQAVCGNTKSNTLTAKVEVPQLAKSKALSTRSSDDCPVSIYMESNPRTGTETIPKRVELGSTIEYSVEVENQTMEDLTDVEIKLHIDDALETDISTAQFDLTGSKENIAGNSNFSARLEGNDVVFKAKEYLAGYQAIFYITCTTKTEGVVSSYASVRSVGGTSYSGIDSRVQYHNAYLEVSELTLKSNISSVYTSTNSVKHNIKDKGRILSYTFNFMKDSKGLTTPLLYQLKSGDNVIKEDSLKLENGVGQLSFSSKYTLVIPQIPVGVTYNITLKKDSDFTWDKESASGTIEPRTASNITFKGTGKYTPVAYSLDTSIEVNMQGRDFKKGDSFSYSIHCEDGPTFNPIPWGVYGDDDEFADFEGIVRINPSSGRSISMSLEEKIETVSANVMGCGLPVRGQDNYIKYHMSTGCFPNHSGPYRVQINTSPEMYFLYPGTYDYIVFQTSMYTDDYDSIIQDTTQYKVSVKVTASGSTLTPSLSLVKKSTDGGKTWVAVADKSKLTFTNTHEGASKYVDFSGNILMDNARIEDYSNYFSFIIEPIGAGERNQTSTFTMPSYMPMPENTEELNNETGIFTFSDIKFVENAIPSNGIRYAYKIYQRQPTTTGKIPQSVEEFNRIKLEGTTMKNINGVSHLIKDGIVYDPTVKTIYVDAVVSNGNIQVGSPNPQFTNSLMSTGTLDGSQLNIRKTINGRDWESTDSFSYTLSANNTTTQTSITNGDITLSKTSLNLGNIKREGNFGNITFDKAGTYSFKVVESAHSIPGLVTQERTKTFSVTAEEDGSGTLNLRVSTSEIEFVSDYQAQSAELSNAISPVVKITGRDWDNTDRYKVSIVADPTDQTTVDAVNSNKIVFANSNLTYTKSDTVSSNGSVRKTLEPVTFEEAGTYRFIAKFEDLSGRQGTNLTGDSEVPFTVTVSENNGNLSASTNTSTVEYDLYYSAEGTLNSSNYKINITLEGREWIGTDSFRFALEGANSTTISEISKGNIFLGTSSITANRAGEYSFGNITFKKEGMYSFKIRQLGVDSNGLTIDNAVRSLDVVVTDINHNGELRVQHSLLGSLTFTNRYSSEVIIEGRDIPVRTTMLDSSNNTIEWDGQEFTYKLQPSDNATKTAITNCYITLGNTSITIDEDSNVYDRYKEGYFGNIKITKEGTYNFEVIQTTTAQDGFNYDTKKVMKIVATDNNLGAIDLELSGEFIFINRYSSSGILNGVYAMSTIEGRQWKDDDSFTYTLEGNNQTTISAIERGDIELPENSSIEITKASASKQADFGYITFNKAGSYAFKITQTSNCGSPLALDENPERSIVVDVREVGGGHLEATSENLTLENLTFTNRYVPSGTFSGINASVAIEGRDYNGDTFNLKVEPLANYDGISGLVTEASATSNSPVTIGAFNATKVGTYRFKVKQLVGNAEGIIYDDTEFEYSVTVTDDTNGNLNCTVSGAENIHFVNQFTTSTAFTGIEIEKVIEGRDWTNNDRFEFVLATEDEVTSTAVANGDVELPSNLVITNANHKGTFGNIVFKKAGTYAFYVQEIAGNSPGLTYDSRKRPLNITVTSDQTTGNLVAEATTVNFNKIFKSVYTASGTLVGSTGLRVQVNGSTGTRIVLEPKQDYGTKVVMPPVNELSVTDNDIISFGNIQFNKTGEYEFTIRQLEGSNNAVEYDLTPHEFTVTVTEGENAVYNVSSTLKDVVTFINVLKKANLNMSLTAVDEDDHAVSDSFEVLVNLKDSEGTALTESYVVVDASGNTIGSIKNGERITLTNGTTVVIKDVPYETRYSVQVEDKENFEYSIDTPAGVISEDNSISISAVKKVSTPVVKYGSLTLTSTITGNDSLGISYLVKLGSSETFNYTGTKQGTIKNGDTITLKNGESITINNIPEGTTYEISTRAGDYETTSKNAKGSIRANTSTFVEFTTTVPVEETTGTLKINGLVNGYKAEYGSVASVKVTLTKDGNELTEELPYTGESDGTLTGSKVFDTVGDTFSLTISDIPEDTHYKVEINDKEFEGGYIGRKSRTNCENVIQGGRETGASFELTAVAHEEIEEFNDIAVHATIENHSQPVKWTLDLKDRNDQPLEGTYHMTGTMEKDIQNGSEITFTNGMNCIIHDLPVGTKWVLNASEISGCAVSVKGASGQLGNVSVPTIEVTVRGTVPVEPDYINVVEVSVERHSKPIEATVVITKDGLPVNTTFNCSEESSVRTVKNGDKVVITDGFKADISSKQNGYVFMLEIPQSNEYTVDIWGKSNTDVNGGSVRTNGYDITGKEGEGQPEYSKLVIISNLASDDSREVTINLKDSNNSALSGEFNYLATNGNSGKIRDGGKITITSGVGVEVYGIPVGSKYSVEVPKKSGYTLNVANKSGTITKNFAEVIVTTTKEVVTDKTTNVEINVTNDTTIRSGVETEILLTDAKGDVLSGTFSCKRIYNSNSAMQSMEVSGRSRVTLPYGTNKFTIEGVPVGTTVRITPVEDVQLGWRVSGDNTVLDNGLVLGLTAYEKQVITPEKHANLRLNTNFNGYTGSIPVTITLKNADGVALTEGFNYTGTKSGKLYNGGKVTFDRPGYIVISNLPVGTKYEMSVPKNSEKYASKFENGTGIIVENGNIANLDVDGVVLHEDYANITIRSEFKNYSSPVPVTVKLMDSSGAQLQKSYKYVCGDLTGEITGTETIAIPKNGVITIKDVPVGSKYRVTVASSSEYSTQVMGDSSVQLGTGSLTRVLITGKTTTPDVETNDHVINYNPGTYTKEVPVKVILRDSKGKELMGEYSYVGIMSSKLSSGTVLRLNKKCGITIKNLPMGTKVELEPLVNPSYKVTVSGSDTVTKDKVGTLNISITEVSVKTTDVTYVFELAGGIKDAVTAELLFRTSANDETPLTGEFEYTSESLGSGVLKSSQKFEITNGTSITVKGIPVGSYCTAKVMCKEGINISVTGDGVVSDKGTMIKISCTLGNTGDRPSILPPSESSTISGNTENASRPTSVSGNQTDRFSVGKLVQTGDKNVVGFVFVLFLLVLILGGVRYRRLRMV